jgi:hypothetical protein
MRFRLLDLALLMLLLAAITGGLFYARSEAFRIYGDEAAQTEWDAWREDASELAKGKGPVARRAPKSVSPPALVLMRDYFAICLIISLTLSAVLFLTTVSFLRGAFSTPAFVDRSPPEEGKTGTGGDKDRGRHK